MAPLIVLIFITGLSRLIGSWGVGYLNSWSAAIAIGLTAMLLLTSSSHFVQPRRSGLVAIVPPRLPAPWLIVTVTGVLELVGAAGLVAPETRDAAAICLGVLFLAMFPANVYAAGARRHPDAPATPLARRTLIQVVYIASCVLILVL